MLHLLINIEHPDITQFEVHKFGIKKKKASAHIDLPMDDRLKEKTESL